ncbi:cold-shock protein [Micromonospora profundi]|uniref:cold-shock protein n=1 Tax=Micromonospora profundi TaxID=1420889 RepID=UPI003650A2B4
MVKWWNSEKGFGFITQDGGPDVFAHFSEIKTSGYRDLKDGARVEFGITQLKKGPMATEIRPI